MTMFPRSSSRSRLTLKWIGTLACLIPLGVRAAPANAFVQTDLVSDVPGLATHLDPNLVNPWGIAFGPTSPFWIANNGTGTSTLYNGEGEAVPLVVTVPGPAGSPSPGTPTGIVFNGGSNFEVGSGQPARFLFANLDGVISGWNPAAGNTAIRKVDNSGTAVYTGLAIGNNGTGDFLYAANFAAGNIDVFDAQFAGVTLAGGFTDPTLPAGYVPFNIQNLEGSLYVTYALQPPGGGKAVPGPGDGFVNVFDLNGNFVKRLISGGSLNAPWGLTLVPEEFGPFEDDLLIGNFGDGRINVFDPVTGSFIDTLRDAQGNPLVIPGLWGLTFGNGGSGGDPDDLYFAAGIDDETHGLFGEIAATTAAAVPETNPAPPILVGAALIGLLNWRRFSQARSRVKSV